MKEEAKKAGSKGGSNVLSGRMLFKFDPTLFQDDEAAAEGDVYEERNEEEEEEKKEDEQIRDGDEGNDEDNAEERKEHEVDAELFQG